MAVDGVAAGIIAIADPIRQTTPEAVRALAADGVALLMMTGDNAVTAHAVARRLGIDKVEADVAPADKARREESAMASLCRGLPRGRELLAAWRSYEAQADPEARFVRQCDRLDMAVQAVAYARAQGLDPAEFLASAAEVIDHPVLLPVLEALRR